MRTGGFRPRHRTGRKKRDCQVSAYLEEVGKEALYREAARVVAEVAEHGAELPLVKENGILEALRPEAGPTDGRAERRGGGEGASLH